MRRSDNLPSSSANAAASASGVTSNAWLPSGTLSIWNNYQLLDGLCAARSLLQINSPGVPVERHIFLITGTQPLGDSVDDCHFCYQPHTLSETVAQFRDFNSSVDTAGSTLGGLTVLPLASAASVGQLQVWKSLIQAAGGPLTEPQLQPDTSALALLQRVRGALLPSFLNIVNNAPANLTTTASPVPAVAVVTTPPTSNNPSPSPGAVQSPAPASLTMSPHPLSGAGRGAVVQAPPAGASPRPHPPPLSAAPPQQRQRIWMGSIVLPNGMHASCSAVAFGSNGVPAATAVGWPQQLGPAVVVNSQTLQQLRLMHPQGPTFAFIPSPEAQQGGTASPWHQLLGQIRSSMNTQSWFVCDASAHKISLWFRAYVSQAPGQTPGAAPHESVRIVAAQMQSLTILQQTAPSRPPPAAQPAAQQHPHPPQHQPSQGAPQAFAPSLGQHMNLPAPMAAAGRGLASPVHIQPPSIQPQPISLFQQQSPSLQQQQQAAANNSRYLLSASNNTITLNSSNSALSIPQQPLQPLRPGLQHEQIIKPPQSVAQQSALSQPMQFMPPPHGRTHQMQPPPPPVISQYVPHQHPQQAMAPAFGQPPQYQAPIQMQPPPLVQANPQQPPPPAPAKSIVLKIKR